MASEPIKSEAVEPGDKWAMVIEVRKIFGPVAAKELAEDLGIVGQPASATCTQGGKRPFVV